MEMSRQRGGGTAPILRAREYICRIIESRELSQRESGSAPGFYFGAAHDNPLAVLCRTKSFPLAPRNFCSNTEKETRKEEKKEW